MPMLSGTPRPARRLAALLATAALTVGLGSSALPVSAQPAEPAGAPGPVHAGNTFGWYGHGGLVYDEDFVGGLGHRWQKEGTGQVRTQHGMLTLNTTHSGDVSAQLMRPGRAYGRWETRMRQREYGGGKAHYRVLAELVPVTKAGEGCGEQNIGLTRFTMGGDKVSMYARSRPDNLYQASLKRGLGQDQWHTYAVEVTKKHISWIVDSHVVRTETRKDALSGRKFQVRFTMQAVKGKVMDKARMQMDWLRYWNLSARNERSIKAPEATKTTYTQSCLGK